MKWFNFDLFHNCYFWTIIGCEMATPQLKIHEIISIFNNFPFMIFSWT